MGVRIWVCAYGCAHMGVHMGVHIWVCAYGCVHIGACMGACICRVQANFDFQVIFLVFPGISTGQCSVHVCMGVHQHVHVCDMFCVCMFVCVCLCDSQKVLCSTSTLFSTFVLFCAILDILRFHKNYFLIWIYS